MADHDLVPIGDAVKLTPEERAAMERLRAHSLTRETGKFMESPYIYATPEYPGLFNTRQHDLDVRTLAAALLREHPADEDEPLDKPWLFSVGGKREDNLLKVTFERGDNLPIGLWDVDDGWKAMLIIAPHAAMQIVRGLKTRGQLRSLAAALGIELKGDGKVHPEQRKDLR